MRAVMTVGQMAKRLVEKSVALTVDSTVESLVGKRAVLSVDLKVDKSADWMDL